METSPTVFLYLPPSFQVKIFIEYIVRRLQCEKRIGKVEQLDASTYRFTADVYETNELVPWIRSFICRIVGLKFSNRTVENKLKQDFQEMYKMYGINNGGDGI